MTRRRKTPQEEKRLSYRRDHRRIAWTSEHGERRLLSRRRAEGHRRARRADQQALAAAEPDFEAADAQHQRLSRARWKKLTELTESLQDRVEQRRQYRRGHFGRKQRSRVERLLRLVQQAEDQGFSGVALPAHARVPAVNWLGLVGLAVDTARPEGGRQVRVIRRVSDRPSA